MPDRLQGKCLCGEVRFTAVPDPKQGGACHCAMCRQWTGGIFLSVDCKDSVEMEPSDALGSYQGSTWGERLFCKKCGSSMIWRTQDHSHNHVSIQCFENPEQFEIGVEVFFDCKPSNYALANKTKTMTEAEVFAMFASEGSANG